MIPSRRPKIAIASGYAGDFGPEIAIKSALAPSVRSRQSKRLPQIAFASQDRMAQIPCFTGKASMHATRAGHIAAKLQAAMTPAPP